MCIRDRVTIRSLAESEDQNVPEFHGLIEKVSVLGFDAEVTYNRDKNGLHVYAKGVDKMCIRDRYRRKGERDEKEKNVNHR